MCNNPLVSICCLSYNHAPFIKACLDGFLCQKTNFGVEILIHDDASTDGTDNIIRQYAQIYPDKIFPLYEKENRYSNGYKGKMDITFNYARAKGKYIATCEGDDFWTDPLKLQKQVDFMESHPEYSVCFHRCEHLDTTTGKTRKDNCGDLFINDESGIDISMEMFFGNWITQPLTMMFRASSFSPEWQKRYHYYRDMHEIYHLLSVGKGYLFAFVGGVYRFHTGGIHSMLSRKEYCRTALPIDKEFYQVSPSKYSRRNYQVTLQEYIIQLSKEHRLKALNMIPQYLRVSHNIKTSIKMMSLILKGGE